MQGYISLNAQCYMETGQVEIYVYLLVRRTSEHFKISYPCIVMLWWANQAPYSRTWTVFVLIFIKTIRSWIRIYFLISADLLWLCKGPFHPLKYIFLKYGTREKYQGNISEDLGYTPPKKPTKICETDTVSFLF